MSSRRDRRCGRLGVFENGVSSVTFGYIIGGWLAIVLAVFAAPLLSSGSLGLQPKKAGKHAI